MANVHATTEPLDSAEWIREKHLTRNFGIGRSPAKRLREEKRIRFVSLREPGMKQGTLLYHVGSVREYLAKKESEKATTGTTTKSGGAK